MRDGSANAGQVGEPRTERHGGWYETLRQTVSERRIDVHLPCSLDVHLRRRHHPADAHVCQF